MADVVRFHVMALGLLLAASAFEGGCRPTLHLVGPVAWSVDVGRCSHDMVGEDRWSRMVRRWLYLRSGRDWFGLT